jgi:hypothetical protein
LRDLQQVFGVNRFWGDAIFDSQNGPSGQIAAEIIRATSVSHPALGRVDLNVKNTFTQNVKNVFTALSNGLAFA